MRFDGTMSAKRRQETIAQFSVPVREDEPPSVATQEAPVSMQATRTRKRTTRSKTIVIDGEVDDDKDDDFVVGDDDDDDDDFIVDDEDRKPSKKGKGKRNATVKTKTVTSTILDDLDFPTYSADGVNPKVMLISLKAGALGLNLTVANNVYL